MQKTLQELLTPEEQEALRSMTEGTITEKTVKTVTGEKVTVIKTGTLKQLLKYDSSGVAQDTMELSEPAVAVKLPGGETGVYPADEIVESTEEVDEAHFQSVKKIKRKSIKKESDDEDEDDMDESDDEDEDDIDESKKSIKKESDEDDEEEMDDDEEDMNEESGLTKAQEKLPPVLKKAIKKKKGIEEDEDEEEEEEVDESKKSTKKESEDDSEDEDKMDDEDIKESLSKLIANDDSLSEDFKSQAAILFEASVAEKVIIIKEEYKTKLAEAKADNFETLAGKIDKFLTSVVEEWVTNNEEQITASVRTNIAESFISNMKTVFENHYIEVPEAKVDMFDEMSTKAADLEEKYEAATETLSELHEHVQKLEKERILKEATEGLVKTDAEKLKNLAESLDFVDVESFTHKIKVVKENFIVNNGSSDKSKGLNEETSDSSRTVTKTTVVEEDVVRDKDDIMGQVLGLLSQSKK